MNHDELRRVLIPFIAGQWSLLDRPTRRTAGGASLNPLHCGAVVASLAARRGGKEEPKS